ncbi:alpha-L-rhamnosidase [Paenibacillus sp. BIHB 4019]|uniref:alpha-L-rhamnosidase n=1 Tax=Paenibacillus sp. BIHB 4019 TaxID=1870819 RepID=A0A1B2DP25_9BACL|nr:alpha-L-rhamnosidase [Paenibacillus sp. BIHB 4019]ANY69465.1 alpha-L-rhamnosidase [Paenibacillus sp. BIHB 4019]
MVQIAKVRCEYLKNPLGIDVPHPRISWQIQSDERGIQQQAYQLQVSLEPEFGHNVWDSGQNASGQSVHVVLDQIELQARTRYYYRVKVWTAGLSLEGSVWSETAYFETGLMDYSAWTAEWISAPSDFAATEEDAERIPLLRTFVTVEKMVKSARIYATALGMYELQWNGNRIGDDYFTPGWTSYGKRLQYQVYDVTDQLAVGTHAIGALLGNGWYKGELGWKQEKETYGSRAALLFQLHISYEDGTEDIVVSNNDWQAAGSAILMSEMYHGERYDARLELDWHSGQAADSIAWQPVETIIHPNSIITQQVNESVRPAETLKPIAVIQTPEGDTVLDFGQNMVGWVKFEVEGAAGHRVELQHAEVLDHAGNFYMGNIRRAEQRIQYTLKGSGKETFEPHFTFQGFRYVKLTGFKAPINLEAFRGIVLHSDMERTGFFECSDAKVNQLHHNIVWGQKGNFVDVPTDCPQRDERLGWTGDAQMFIRTASYVMNVAPFFTKWLQDLKADQTREGGIPFYIPNLKPEFSEGWGDTSHSSAAWGDAAVICPWTIYEAYGDARLLEAQYDSMNQWIQYIYGQGSNPYLWNTGFHFGDWLGLDSKPNSYVGATDRDLIATAYYAYSVSLVAKAAKALGKETEVERLAAWHKQIIAAFQHEFLTPSGRLSVPTQTAQVLALRFGLVSGAAKERAEQKLAELLKEQDDHLTTGFVGTPYLNPVLSEAGRNDLAYRLLLQEDYPSWLYQITKGATTIWEHWDGIKEDGSFWSEDMNSFNHYAYGAIGEWLYSYVAGIQPDEEEPGFKHVKISPQPGPGLTWAEARLTTMYGVVVSSWRRKEAGRMEIQVTVPGNARATLKLPEAQAAADVLENGTALSQTAGITAIYDEAGSVTLELGSGQYHFAYDSYL